MKVRLLLEVDGKITPLDFHSYNPDTRQTVRVSDPRRATRNDVDDEVRARIADLPFIHEDFWFDDAHKDD